MDGSTLQVNGDLNSTVPFKIIGAPSNTKTFRFNGVQIPYTTDAITGDLRTTLKYAAPKIKLPDFKSLTWRYLDDLPEIQPSYNDLEWPKAHVGTTNPTTPLLTPTSLFSGDYGFHAAMTIFRGHFVANGKESSLYLSTQGGAAYGKQYFKREASLVSRLHPFVLLLNVLVMLGH